MPGKLKLYLTLGSSPYIYNNHINSWSESKYDLDFSAMKSLAESRVYIATFSANNLYSTSPLVIDYALGSSSLMYLAGKVRLDIVKNGIVHGLVGWFETQLSKTISLSTSPLAKKTHWEQSFLPFSQPLKVKKGDHMDLFFSVESSMRNNTVCFKWNLKNDRFQIARGSFIV